MILETERLEFRRLTPADAERLFALDSDPQVRRYVHAGPPDLARIREEILPRMRGYDAHYHDLGFWAVEEKPDGGFAGWFCLRPEAGLERDPELEVGFRLRRKVWGRGLATEGARALVATAFAAPETQRVVAVTLAENHASRRVLEKLGFESVEEFVYEPPPGAVIEDAAASRGAHRYVLTRMQAMDAGRSGSRGAS